MSVFAFAISIYAQTSIDYVEETSQKNLDRITKKYFDSLVSDYETSFTTILKNGNITSTGWGATPTVYILKEIFTHVGSKNVIFYTLDPTIGESMEYNQYLNKILNGQFKNLGNMSLFEFHFFKKFKNKLNLIIF